MQKFQEIRVRPVPFWLEVRLPVTKRETIKIIGEPCKSYEKECPVCEGWKSYNEKGFITILLDRDELVRRESEPVNFN